MYEEYMEHFPDEISEDIKKYATDVALKESRYIFTRRQGKHQHGYCTHCQNEFKTIGLRHNEIAECPKCNSMCKIKASGRGRKYMLDEVYFTYYEKSKKNPNAIIARGIYATRNYRDDYHDVETNYWIEALYIFEMGKSIMFKSIYYKRDYYEKCNSVYSLNNYWNTKSYIMNTCYSRESIKKAVEGTPFQYSTWQKYNHKDMVEFLDLYSKHPCIEYLTKEGLEDLVNDKLAGYRTYRAINWKGKSIFKILKINKQDLREIKNKNINITFEFLKIFQDAKKYKWNLTLDETLHLNNDYLHYYEDFIEMSKYSSPKKLLNYCSRQYLKFNCIGRDRHYYDASAVVRTFKDYIADCKTLNMDISNEHVIFPKDLYAAHQNTLKQIKIQENEKYDKLISKRLKSLEKYIFESNELIIRPAKSSMELIEEGANLHHCVAAHYTEKYARGKTNILLIRKRNEINQPYFTVEIQGNNIMQVRGLRNCNPNKEVSEFIEVFKKTKLIKKPASKVRIPA